MESVGPGVHGWLVLAVIGPSWIRAFRPVSRLVGLGTDEGDENTTPTSRRDGDPISAWTDEFNGLDPVAAEYQRAIAERRQEEPFDGWTALFDIDQSPDPNQQLTPGGSTGDFFRSPGETVGVEPESSSNPDDAGSDPPTVEALERLFPPIEPPAEPAVDDRKPDEVRDEPAPSDTEPAEVPPDDYVADSDGDAAPRSIHDVARLLGAPVGYPQPILPEVAVAESVAGSRQKIEFLSENLRATTTGSTADIAEATVLDIRRETHSTLRWVQWRLPDDERALQDRIDAAIAGQERIESGYASTADR